MIPILYHAGERSFTNNGIGRLTDCLSFVVSEERNGVYEAEFDYPCTGIHYSDIIEGRIVACTHDDTGDIQPFIIYRHSAPINGIVTFNAHHVSYKLNHVIVKPFTAISALQAMAAIPNNLLTDSGFTFWTNKNTSADLKFSTPRSVRNLLGGQEGSILDVYGGEYEFDKYTVKLHASRGSNNGAQIRYGKNLSNIEHTFDQEGVYTAIIPIWYDAETDTCITGSLNIAAATPIIYELWTDENGTPINDDNGNVFEFAYQDIIPVVYDFTNDFEDQPSVAQLNAAAQAFMSANQPYLPSQNLVVDFVALWQTEEYKDYAPLQSVKLCDTVSVIYPELGLNVAEKVIRTTYNVLLDRYDEIELGKPQYTYADILLESTKTEIALAIDAAGGRDYNAMQQAIAEATQQLTGNNGGSHIVFTLNADGGMEEMFIMDTDDVETAQNVWRYNSAGWGHSSTGKSGPYTTAATQQGSILADFITTGVLQGYSDQNYWNLTTGYLCAEKGQIGSFTFENGRLDYFAEFEGAYGSATIAPSFLRYGTEVWNSGVTERTSGSYSYMDYEGFSMKLYHKLWNPTNKEVFRLTYLSDYEYDGRDYDFKIYGQTGGVVLGYVNSEHKVYSRTNWRIESNFEVQSGYTKSKIIDTGDYADRLVYCYETASPMYGDIGEGQIGDDGKCYVWLDPIFAETINTDQYQVFLQAYGDGKAYVSERHPGYFVVEGTAGLPFGWELKAKQGDLENVRLEQRSIEYQKPVEEYGEGAKQHIEEIMKERGLNG